MRIAVDVPHERLSPGPCGARVEVIDYDPAAGRYYQPIDLDDPHIAMQSGLDPSESDPRFHQQMVYAVSMRTLENFDVALGHRVRFHRGRPLRIHPHAFRGANAYFDPELRAVLFGYFTGDDRDAGSTLPGQTVFSCLSHDIVAHEVTHALVHRLRPYFLEPTNLDVAGFHEGFSDVVAVLQHFSFPGILRETIRRSGVDLRSSGPYVELAREFGHATGGGQALRSALDQPDPTLYRTLEEPHDRGSILLAAVFDAFFRIYQRRTEDLLRIATGGTRVLPAGDLPPDLVGRLTDEASRVAQSLLLMCIRAFEYLPPVDVTYGDYLRALVTADFEIAPEDPLGQRAAMIEAFRVRGVYPEDVVSLAEESLIANVPERRLDLPLEGVRGDLFRWATDFSLARGRANYGARRQRRDAVRGVSSERETGGEELDLEERVVKWLWRWGDDNKKNLGLDPSKPLAVRGFHPLFRVARGGHLLIELVVQFVQRDRRDDEEWGGVPLRGGVTAVVDPDEGRVKYLIHKPLPAAGLSRNLKTAAQRRVERQREFVAACDRSDARLAWSDADYRRRRIAARMSFKNLHARRPR